MELTSPIRYLSRIPRLAGAEILLDEGGRLECSLAVVIRAGSRVRQERGEYGLDDYAALGRHVPPGVPLVVTLGGKGVIHRVFPAGGLQAGGDALRQVLPNARPEDFYMQHAVVAGADVVSIIRRDVLDGLLTRLDGEGLSVVQAGLGPFGILALGGGLVPADAGTLALGRHHLAIRDGRLEGYRLLPADSAPTGRAVELGGEPLNERLVPAFAAALLAIGDLPVAVVPVPALETRLADHRNGLAFRWSAMALGVCFVALLLGNALLFMHYNDKVDGFAGSDGLSIQREIDALRQQGRERDALLDGLWPEEAPGWGMAWMADRLAGSVPAGIRLSELSFFPRDEGRSRRQRRPVHAPATVRIKGTCGDIPELNGWIGRLRGLAFCRSVEIDAYDDDQRDAGGLFTLTLTLQP